MKRSNIFSTILLVAMLCFILVQPVSAWTISHATADPSGALQSGTPVVVSLSIDFTPSDTESAATNTLVLGTQLENPVWKVTYTGETIPELDFVFRTQNITLPVNGTGIFDPDLASGRGNFISVQVVLEGSTPAVDGIMNRTYIDVRELDSRNRLVGGSYFLLSGVIVNSCVIGCPDQFVYSQAQDDLQQFRTHIDSYAGSGVDTSEAENTYHEAKGYLSSAARLQGSKIIDAHHYVTEARNAIANGTKALDKASAGKEIASAQKRIDDTGAVIGWFWGNLSTRDDVQVPLIIAGRSNAADNLSHARDQFALGNYSEAWNLARSAYSQANESYSEAVRRQEAMGVCNFCLHPITPALLLIIPALVAAGVLIAYLYRKRKRTG